MSTTQKLRTKTVEGYNVYLQEGNFNMADSDSSSLVTHSRINPRSVVLFSRVVFGRTSDDIFLPDRLTRRIGDETEDEDIERRRKQSTPNIVDLRKIRQIIERERSLMVPRTIKDNLRSPWELVILDPNAVDERTAKYKKSTSTREDPLDEILASLTDGDNSLGTVSTVFIAPPKMLAKCSYHESGLEIKPLCNELYASKVLMLEGIFYKDVKKFRSIIQVLFANAIIEKIVSKINIDLKGIQGLNPKSFWNSIVYDDVSQSFDFLERRMSKNSFIQHHQDAPQKGYLLDTLATIIELVHHDPQMVMKMCGGEIEHGGKSNSGNDMFDFIDGYGASKYLLNHPFLFYCVVDDKVQMYKFFVTKLTPSSIEYELYQIDSLNKNITTFGNINSTINVNIRPKVITRNISDKFSFRQGSPSSSPDPRFDSKTEPKKFVIDYEKSFIKVTRDEVTSLSDTVFQKINTYVNYVASIVGVVINDATRCVKAFINNQKKIKVDFDPTKVALSDFNSVLNELQLISDARTETGPALCEATDQVDTNRDLCRVLKGKIAPNFDSAVSTNDSYVKSKLYSTYHPLSYLSRLMTTNVITKGGSYTESNFVPLFTNREFFKKVVTKQEGVGKGSIIHKKVVDTAVMRDVMFSSDGSTYHHMNGFTQTDGSKIILDLRIKSNCRLKLYARVENNCQLIGEGENIYVPILYTEALNSVFIKLDSNPDEIIESLVRSKAPPFIKTSYVSLSTSADVEDPPSGFITECISNYGEKNQYATSTMYIDKETDTKKRMVYFGTINSKSHFESIENMFFGEKSDL
ncbi:hypothetical protein YASMINEVIRUS_70 [Yasminevirus sp. GU-2018]|uniref:Uncharacterized protein n=1 Tax=Yasminevirus sp. GU-2018 TaxID=2420051 RepID=A0A5K0U7A4_9VIRU|nr:hypothetical protein YASMINEVIRUS_70 [Yasminevirus sp. GU-2018]